MTQNIIVALDGLKKQDALTLADRISGLAWGFKVHDLLLSEGPGVVAELKNHGRVFADLKFHDIPQTVANEVSALVEHGADLVSVHASGGEAMLKAAVTAGDDRVVAISVLSSLNSEEVVAIYHNDLEKSIEKLVSLSAHAGVKNVVCSPHEIALVKKTTPKMTVITPGIRSESDEKHDQERTMSAHEAVVHGADLLVIGRPITKAPNPRSALEAIISTL